MGLGAVVNPGFGHIVGRRKAERIILTLQCRGSHRPEFAQRLKRNWSRYLQKAPGLHLAVGRESAKPGWG